MLFDYVVQNREWTVQELSIYIKQKIDKDFMLRNICVKGEVIKPVESGEHLYFNLRDSSGENQIKCVFFWYKSSNIKIKIKHGLRVVVTCNVIYYEKEGIVELKVTDIKEDGLGEIFEKLKQLEEKLLNEGLFEQKHKKCLPEYPQKIGIVTSKSGAAVRDIINTILSQFKNIEIYIYNCQVQGANAVSEICEGIDYFNTKQNVDVIIVGRGGGSFEDLLPFSSEEVVRKIFDSKIPIISAVGHERDYVLSDFVADFKAITPTHAGQIVVKKQSDIIENINAIRTKIIYLIKQKIDNSKKDLEILTISINQNSPVNITVRKAQYVDTMRNKLKHLITSRISIDKSKFDSIDRNLIYFSPINLCNHYRSKIEYDKMLLRNSIEKMIIKYNNIFDRNIEKIVALNPLNTLRRGFTITLFEDKILKSIKDLKNEDCIQTKFIDGLVYSKVLNIVEERADNGNN